MGCDPFRGGRCWYFWLVSIHAPAWGATAQNDGAIGVGVVSIHAPAWGATCPSAWYGARGGVSIHAPAWGATPMLRVVSSCAPSFNPRTRVGCDLRPGFGGILPYTFQSTHPRGVRHHHDSNDVAVFLVSIHAPAWGATGTTVKITLCAICFNPRTRVGCDGSLLTASVISTTVSIHAPAWGATRSTSVHLGWVIVFQSTHPRGVRLRANILLVVGLGVSIHAPAWGATTRRPHLRGAFRPVSIHAPAWGATADQ